MKWTKQIVFLSFVFLLAAIVAVGCSRQKKQETASTKQDATRQRTETRQEKMENTTSDTNAEEMKAIEETKADSEVAVLETNQGTIVIGFFPDVAPKHVTRFKELVKEGFYDGILFHRVIPGFVVQAGDPNTKNPDFPREKYGSGGSDKGNLPDEYNSRPHIRGTLSAASTPQPNSSNSQFFICVARIPHLDGKYTVYGQVIQGMDVVDRIVNTERDRRDNPIEPMKIIRATLAKRSDY